MTKPKNGPFVNHHSTVTRYSIKLQITDLFDLGGSLEERKQRVVDQMLNLDYATRVWWTDDSLLVEFTNDRRPRDQVEHLLQQVIRPLLKVATPT